MKIKEISLKKLIKVLVVTAVFSVILLGLVIWIFNIPAYFRGEKGSYAMTPENSVKVSVNKTYEIDDIKSIEGDLLFSDIDVTVTEGDSISFVYTGSVMSRPEFKEPFLIFNESSGRLTVKSTLPGNYSVANSTIVLKLSIPQNKLEELKLTTSSGDITVFGTPSEKLSVDTTSGDIAINGFKGKSLRSDSSSGDQDYIDLNSQDISMVSSSGSITIDRTSVIRSKLETSSGDIRSSLYSSEENHIDTTSGNVKMESYSGNMDFSSSSGSLQIDFEKEGDEITADTTSGDVSLIFPGETGFKIRTETTSGNFKIDFPLTLEGDYNEDKISGRFGDGSGLLKISTSSGDITIKSK